MSDPEQPSPATLAGYALVFALTLALCLLYRHAGG